MPLKLVVFLIIISILFLIFVWSHVFKRKLLINYALLWVIFSTLMIIAALIPDFLKIICNFIGIKTASNFIFFLGFCLLLMITFFLTEIISIQKNKITTLAQEIAILKNKHGDENGKNN